MKKLLFLSSGHAEGSFGKIAAQPGWSERTVVADLYSLDEQELDRFDCLLISMHVDQRFLSARAAALTAFIRAGGTAVVNGQIAYPFLGGLTVFQPLLNARIDDLTVHREAAHPVWDGVNDKDLTFRRGVAGFYGRGWHQPPSGATVVHSLGKERRPLDFEYRLGDGRVLVHGGNDLWQYGGAGDTTARIVPQLLGWISSGKPH